MAVFHSNTHPQALLGVLDGAVAEVLGREQVALRVDVSGCRHQASWLTDQIVLLGGGVVLLCMGDCAMFRLHCVSDFRADIWCDYKCLSEQILKRWLAVWRWIIHVASVRLLLIVRRSARLVLIFLHVLLHDFLLILNDIVVDCLLQRCLFKHSLTFFDTG